MVKNNKVGDLVALWPIELANPVVGIVTHQRADGCFTVFAINHVYKFVEQICLSDPDSKPTAYYDCSSYSVMSKKIGYEIDTMIMDDLLGHTEKN